MQNVTSVFLMGIRNLADSVSDSSVAISLRKCLLDYLGVTLSESWIISKKGHYIWENLGCDDICHVIGTNKTAPTSVAALLNGISAHVIELDDGHRRGAVHIGATIFSALLAVAEDKRINSEDFLRGVLVGYETTIRLACAVQLGNKLRGYHATGTCGTVGAALGIAAALHYTEEQMNTTLAAAVTSAAGVLEMQEDNSDLKPYNVGRAAMDAVVAACIGRTDLKGPKDALGGKRGFLKVMTDDPHTEFLTDFNSKTLCIEQIYQKIYAACRHAHPAIEAALALRGSVMYEEIEKIEVQAYKSAVAGHDHTEIASINSAKMSIPFCVAVALITGEAGLNAFVEENIYNPIILSLAKKVQVLVDEDLTVQSPVKRASIVSIYTSTGKFTKRVDYPKGEPENPLTQQELEAKFRGLAMYGGLTEKECDEVIGEVWKEDFDLGKIMRIICK